MGKGGEGSYVYIGRCISVESRVDNVGSSLTLWEKGGGAMYT